MQKNKPWCLIYVYNKIFLSANWENMMSNMNIGGQEMGEEEEEEDSDDDGG